MPHAMERSVATPTMKARLPARNPIRSLPARIMPEVAPVQAASGSERLAVARVQTDAQLLPGVEPGPRVQAVPGEQLRDAALEEPRYLRHGVALAHRVEEPPVVSTGAAGPLG